MTARSSEKPPAAFNTEPSAVCTKFDAARQTTDIEDPVQQLVNGPEADIFRTNLADESTLILVFDKRSFVDEICFGGETFDKCLGTLDRLLTRFEECRINISFTKSIFAQPKVDFVSHKISNEGIQADNKKMEAITQLPFPKTKKGVQSFLGALNYYSRFIQDFAVFGAALRQLKDEDFGKGGDLSTARRSFDALKVEVAEPRFFVTSIEVKMFTSCCSRMNGP
ncbi:hypothetical protein PHMEG_0002720 [Phytophthora megakarya]|uniref:Reverse transcriptase/retrotransposon-derived protein RNase H-like domain-containing protein n=1 Tax=Phytophthora megakarya TaxID=4795 RepID=A0A225WZU9_9STRA|nr:hypothetical protein PHMEG_0002720 [Phytophthora megakarya]